MPPFLLARSPSGNGGTKPWVLSLVERLPDQLVAERFGFSIGYLRVMRLGLCDGHIVNLDFHAIPHEKRKYPQPMVYESRVELRGYDGELRQIVVRGNGREKPSFLVSNDFETPVEFLVGNYARRWRVENGIAKAVKFFHLNALSSPILTKVHFDVVMTMIAATATRRLSVPPYSRCISSRLTV